MLISRHHSIAASLLFSLAVAAFVPPVALAEGSNSVFINGKSARRVGDRDASGKVMIQASPSVFINGKPAAIRSKKGCVNSGSSNVFINGKPAARNGDGCSK
jgi:uncharacterized Zn-binding protein involved in type VI secretion